MPVYGKSVAPCAIPTLTIIIFSSRSGTQDGQSSSSPLHGKKFERGRETDRNKVSRTGLVSAFYSR
jgi:hypothetical protein